MTETQDKYYAVTSAFIVLAMAALAMIVRGAVA
jgi:hypothetical protein